MQRIIRVSKAYPDQFWVLMGASLVDSVGNWMLFPFYTLYFSQRFGVGMTEVGAIFGVFSLGMLLGNLLGGPLTDKFGRKNIIIVGLVASALTSLCMVSIGYFPAMYILSTCAGIFGDISGPARGAMIADLLEKERRADGYAISRINLNLAAAIGPMIGGLLANFSFVFIFAADALTSVLTAGIVYFAIQESMGAVHDHNNQESMGQMFKGYRVVLKDLIFVAFLLVSVLVSLVYMQIYFSLPIFMHYDIGFAPQQYGYLLGLNALIVIILQLGVTRWTSRFPAMVMASTAVLLYGLGFAIFGLTTIYSLFAVAMVIITFGEMIWSPTWQATVANFASEAYRGRYIAAGSMAMMAPGALGPSLIGMIIDNFGGAAIWYIAGVLCLVASVGYLLIYWHTSHAQGEESQPVMPSVTDAKREAYVTS